MSQQQKFFVTMTDKFMSGWGMARGKVNKLVIECDNLAEAEIVAQNGRNRSEMKYVNIRSSKPYFNPSRFEVSWHDRSDYDRWFVSGAF